ncbi:hypothetical protein OS122_02630 [Mycolicibacterium mucogenicum]|uniref:hypothetical protein n=1 Tax=Mycolicibacterium mucogenicum TaxID=56689 RepID=UPI002269F2C6|nr:hypothetical protein [Mycolicibacterium mucogenicum]MCX8559795.1 hypothetical protein [Mycolicibacterium mucogenicum]
MTATEFADQEFLSDPDIGIVGDCWRACIANALELPIADVPHFVRDYDSAFLEATQAWLELNDVPRLLFRCAFFPIAESLKPFGILVGRSPRDVQHAVLVNTETGEIVHDPHPSRAGLTSIAGAYVFAQIGEPV